MVTREEVNYVTAPLKLAAYLSEQPWAEISSDKDGTCELVKAIKDEDVLIDRCAAVLLSRIVSLVKSREKSSLKSKRVGRQATIPGNNERNSNKLTKRKSRRLSASSIKVFRKLSLKHMFRGSFQNVLTKENSTSSLFAKAMYSKSSYQKKCKERNKFPIIITTAVHMQVREYVAKIASWYQKVPYHTFEHATHVLLSANKLLFLLITASEEIDDPIKRRSYGLTTNFGHHLALIFAALVHDVDHGGVSNQVLIDECDPLSILYNDQSVLEQRSLAVAFTVLMEPQFEELRHVMFPTQKSFMEFRKIVIDLVLTTDIASGERMQIVKSKWKEAFGSAVTFKKKLSNGESQVSPSSANIGNSQLSSIVEKRVNSENEKLTGAPSQNSIQRSIMHRRLSVSPANSFSSSESNNEEDEDCYENKISFQRPTGDFRRHTIEPAHAKSDFVRRDDLIDHRQTLPVRSLSVSGRRSASYRLGIKRAMTLSGDIIEEFSSSKEDSLKSIVVLEWMMKAADVSSLMQSFSNFMKWSSRLYDEIYIACRDGRTAVNPANGWNENQLTFFDSYITQLAVGLRDTDVFGEAGILFLENVHRNRERWILDGHKLTYELVEGADERTKSISSVKRRVNLGNYSGKL